MRRLGPTDDPTEELWARFVALSEKSLLTQIREMLWECHLQANLAWDVLQESYLEAWQKRGSFRGESQEKLLAWVRSISRFKVRNLRRWARFHSAAGFDSSSPGSREEWVVEPLSRDPTPESAFKKKEQRLWIDQRVNTLNDAQKRLVVGFFIRGVPLAHLAKNEGLHVSTVRKRLNRALGSLRHRLPRDLLQ